MQHNALLLPHITDFTQGLWAIRPKPFPDELLSSWLVRLAARNSLKLHTFCRMMFSRDRNIWNRDIDKLADSEFLRILIRGTGATEQQALQTSLRAYEGWIYSAHNPYGNTKWILPLGVYHRLRKGRGMQFCPHCLEQDKSHGRPYHQSCGPYQPYFRKRWRVGFMVACAEHQVEMLSHCPACEAPVCFHRREMGDKCSFEDGDMHFCYNCDQDLSRSITRTLSQDEMPYHQFLSDGLSNGWMTTPDGKPVYAHLYLDVLHQIMKQLISRKSRNLGALVSKASDLDLVTVPPGHVEIEQLGVKDRRLLILQARWLLDEWPDRFLRLCKDNQIWSAWLLRDMPEVPWWFSSVVHQELYVRYAPYDPTYYRNVRRHRAALKRLYESEAG